MRRLVGTCGSIARMLVLVGTVTIVGCALFQPEVHVDFTAAPSKGGMPLVVEFAPVVVGDIATCYWEFGDGRTSSDISPVHVYGVHGFYDVRLTVTLEDGRTGSLRKANVIDVEFVEHIEERVEQPADLYWISDRTGQIHRGYRGGEEVGASEEFTNHRWPLGDGAESVNDLAVGGGHVYWAAGSCIYWKGCDHPLSGSGYPILYDDQHVVRGIAVDGEDNSIYWVTLHWHGYDVGPYATYFEGHLKRAVLDGPEGWVHGSEGWVYVEEYWWPDVAKRMYPWHMCADTGSQRLVGYYDDGSYDPRDVLRPRDWVVAPPDMTDGMIKLRLFKDVDSSHPRQYEELTLVGNMGGVKDLVFDAGPGRAYYIYWVTDDSIYSLRLYEGAAPSKILDGLPFPQSVAVDLAEGRMYWSDDEGIHRAALDGTGDELIYPGVLARVLALPEF